MYLSYKIILFVDDGKAKVLFGNVFEFEFTLVSVSVPSNSDTMYTENEKCCCAAWFILGDTVDSMKFENFSFYAILLNKASCSKKGVAKHISTTIGIPKTSMIQ